MNFGENEIIATFKLELYLPQHTALIFLCFLFIKKFASYIDESSFDLFQRKSISDIFMIPLDIPLGTLGQAQFKNLAAFAAKLLKCIWLKRFRS